MKENKLFKLAVFGFLLLTSFFFYSCTTNQARIYEPIKEEAVNPPMLSVDIANCAYLGGAIRAIDDYDFDPIYGALRDYSYRTLRVPVEQKRMVALVHYNFIWGNTNYYGFKYILLPPLENGGLYMLYIDPKAGGRLWDDRQAVLKKLNNDSGIYENVVPGAVYVQ
jgi:hypothetical protein